MHCMLTALEGDLQLVAVVALQRRPELALQQRQHHRVHHLAAVAVAAAAADRARAALQEHELRLQRDVAAGGAHALRHPPQLEPEAAHEPQVPATQRTHTQ